MLKLVPKRQPFLLHKQLHTQQANEQNRGMIVSKEKSVNMGFTVTYATGTSVESMVNNTIMQSELDDVINTDRKLC